MGTNFYSISVHSISTNKTLFYTDVNLSNIQSKLNVNLIKFQKRLHRKDFYTISISISFLSWWNNFDLDEIDYKFLPEEFYIDQIWASHQMIHWSLASAFQANVIMITNHLMELHPKVLPPGISCEQNDEKLSEASIFFVFQRWLKIVNWESIEQADLLESMISILPMVFHPIATMMGDSSVRLDDFEIADGVPPHCTSF